MQENIHISLKQTNTCQDMMCKSQINLLQCALSFPESNITINYTHVQQYGKSNIVTTMAPEPSVVALENTKSLGLFDSS